MKKIYYEKIGRRYVPVAEYDKDWEDSFTKGTHVVMCYPGGQSRRYNIDPNYAAMIAAGRIAEDAISESIMDASAARAPTDRPPITEEQKAAWEHLSELMGIERYPLEYCSYLESARVGVEAMMREADKLMDHPSVRQAFEQFLMVCKLTKAESNND